MIPGSSTKKFSSEAVNVSKWVPRHGGRLDLYAARSAWAR